MAKEEEDTSKIAMGCVLLLLMIPVGILLKGFVLCQTWAWFMVPLGVVAIGQAHAYGLATMATLFIYTGSHSANNDSEKSMGHAVLKAFGTLIVVPLVVWGVAWICHMYM